MPDKSLHIACLQMDLHWQNPALNRANADQWLASLAAPTDLILLPEMFSTGFTMNAAEVAEEMQGESVSWMQKVAQEHDCLVGGSLVIREHEHFYNRFVWMNAEGILGQYDKRHLFAMAGEDKPYESGSRQEVVYWRGWNIATQICYDLRFPVWARNRFEPDGQASYDLLVNVANWPMTRIHHWDTLLQARAIENLAFVAGVNRVGKDANGYDYTGSSRIIGFDGKILSSAVGQEALLVAELDPEALAAYRARFPFWKEADTFVWS
ncbi:MAG: amidohydrolase [Bacteroidia bacterium]|nr:amidohydrolase [Bacteroidia bacterium]